MQAKNLLLSLGYFPFLTNLPAMLVEELQTSIFPCFESIVNSQLSGCAPPVPAPAGGPGLQLPDWRGGRPAPRPPPAAGGHRAREPLAGERPDAGTRYYVQLPCVDRCWVLPGQLLLHGRKRHFWQRSTGVRLSVGRVELVRGDQPGYEVVTVGCCYTMLTLTFCPRPRPRGAWWGRSPACWSSP